MIFEWSSDSSHHSESSIPSEASLMRGLACLCYHCRVQWEGDLGELIVRWCQELSAEWRICVRGWECWVESELSWVSQCLSGVCRVESFFWSCREFLIPSSEDISGYWLISLPFPHSLLCCGNLRVLCWLNRTHSSRLWSGKKCCSLPLLVLGFLSV